MTAAGPPDATAVAAFRRFNRFYTRKLGVLEETLLGSEFSLAESRVLYELANRRLTTASEMNSELHLDPGYLSRILRNLEARGLLARRPSPHDGRQVCLRLTKAGRRAFAPLDLRAQEQASEMLAKLDGLGRQRLLAAMQAIEHLLGSPQSALVLRSHQPGDLGWVVSRHGAIYAEEYGFAPHFEALVAEVAAGILKRFDPAWECSLIAEIDGERVGSAFVVKESAKEAKLRLLLVEPRARGLGIGARLVKESIAFARRHGYSRVSLWTQDILTVARNIYRAAGFRLIAQEPHALFGRPMIGETWQLELSPP